MNRRGPLMLQCNNRPASARAARRGPMEKIMTHRTTLGLFGLIGGYAVIALATAVCLGLLIAPQLGVLAFLFALAIAFLVAGTALVMAMFALDGRPAAPGSVTS